MTKRGDGARGAAGMVSPAPSLMRAVEAVGAGSGAALLRGTDSVYIYADPRFLELSPETPVLGRTYGEVWPEIVQGCSCNLTLTVSPLEHEGRLYGLVRADTRTPREERRGTGEPAEGALADELEKTRRSHERTVVLREIALAAAGTTDLRSLGSGILDVFNRRLGADQGLMFLSEEGLMHEVASFGPCAENHGTRRIYGETLLRHAIASGGRLTHDMPLPEALAARVERMRLSEKRWALLPVLAKGEVLGAISLTFPDRRDFTAEELRLYDAIDQQIGVAIEKVMLFEELRETTRLGEALDEINGVLLASLDPREILERSVAVAYDVLPSDGGAAVELVGERLVCVASRGMSLMPPPEAEATPDSCPGVRWALEHDDVLAAEDVTRDRRVNGERLKSLGVSSLLILPLKLRRRAFGALAFGYSEPHAFTDAEADFAQKLASAVSLALESARLYENERFIAETLQESLLSLPDQVEGLEIAHLYSSATNTARVGGDFYDVFELAHGNVGVLIGDVSGKGVDAAVLTSLVKNTLRAHSVTPGRTPGYVVKLTSDEVLRRTLPEAFVTLLFGILDRRDGRFVYCNAAHTEGCIRRADGETNSLGANSSIVGAFADIDFADSEAYLDYGDELWLYTDGLTEARVATVQFGEERLRETLERSEGESLEARLGDLLGEVVRFAQGNLSDDIAMLVIRRTGQPNEPLQQKFDPRELWG